VKTTRGGLFVFLRLDLLLLLDYGPGLLGRHFCLGQPFRHLRSHPPAAARPAPCGVGYSVIGSYET
jgi:hypothetical protein